MTSLPKNPQENLVALITRHQGPLHSFILSLMPDRAMADDVLQETNLVLWRKADDYDPARPFMPWACRIAHFQVKAARRDAARDRHVFDPEVIDLLAAEDDPTLESTEAMDHALRDCLEELPADKRTLILNRYENGISVTEMAFGRKMSVGALSTQLHRIRQLLGNCVHGKLGQEPS